MAERNRGIDYIKGVMSIIILLYHYTVRYAEMLGKQPYPYGIPNGGTIGVAVFFIISSIFAMRGISKSAPQKLVPYMRNKLLRIYPAYATCITITFVWLTIYPIDGLTVGIKDYVINLLLVQRFIGANAVDGAHWYIAFLLVMYLMFWGAKKQKCMIKREDIYFGWWYPLSSALNFGLSLGLIMICS